MMTKNRYILYGIFVLVIIGIIFLAGCIKTTTLSLKYDDNINDRFTVNNNEVTFSTFSEAKGGEVCKISFVLSNVEKDELIQAISVSDFFNINEQCQIVKAELPHKLWIKLDGKENTAEPECSEKARKIIYKLEEFTANREAQLKEECVTDYMPRYSFCGAGTSNVHKVKESWVENGKNCICQSYENIVCE